MNDKYDFKELIGARLEEIHLAESLPEKMPSDEDILRWETLANARLSARKRKRKQLLSIAAVLLLAVVISVAAIVAPPDAEAGGDGKAVLVENGGMEITEYKALDDISQELQKKFVCLNIEKYGYVVESIKHIKTKNTEQLDITFNKSLSKIIITEIIGGDNVQLKSESNYLTKKEKWGKTEVYLAEAPYDASKKTYNLVYNGVYISIYTEGVKIEKLQRMVEEAF